MVILDVAGLLRLQSEWGADEALAAEPVSRLRPAFANPAMVQVAALSSAARILAPSVAQAATTQVLTTQATTIQAHTIQALYDDWAAFDGCALRATATTIVRPSGTVPASILMLGDAPSADDDRAGVAFAGATGVLLDRVMASVGLGRDQVLLAHLIPWRPPGGRPPSEAELRSCLPFVHQLLRLAGALHVVLMGQAAIRLLLNLDERPSRLRGRWQDLVVPDRPQPMSALAMAPAEAWLRTPAAKRDTWNDMLLLRSKLS